MKKILIPIFALFMAFTSCDSDDIKELTPEQKQAKLEQEDVNGEYLLTKIYQGDFPMVECTYDDNNRLSNISKYSNHDYGKVLDYRLSKEYNAKGFVSKLTLTENYVDDYDNETETYDYNVSLEYDSKGNLIKVQPIFEDDEYDEDYPESDKDEIIEEYYTNNYNSKNLLIKSEMFTVSDGVATKDKSFIKYEYNSLDLRIKVIFVDDAGKEETLSLVKYDKEGNPIEISNFNPATYDWGWDYEKQEGFNTLVSEASFASLVTIEYDYTKKNFLKHSLGLLFPEVSKFEMNNAPISIQSSQGKSVGSITYAEFNEGGYPELIKYLAVDDEGLKFNGEVKLEFTKKK